MHLFNMSKFRLDETSQDEELITCCLKPPHECILGGAPYGNKVIKISPRTAIKFGFGVTEMEAINQSNVYELVDPPVVGIPKVYRYFSDYEGRGYIVMGFMKAKVMDPLEDPIQVTKIARIADHLGSFRRVSPDPVATLLVSSFTMKRNIPFIAGRIWKSGGTADYFLATLCYVFTISTSCCATWISLHETSSGKIVNHHAYWTGPPPGTIHGSLNSVRSS